MELRDKISGVLKRKSREEKNLEQIEEAMTEAWLRQYLLTRFSRWIIGIVIAVLASVALADATNVESDRNGCERRQEIFLVIAEGLENENPNSEEAKIVRRNIVADCDTAYPHAYPMKWFVD